MSGTLDYTAELAELAEKLASAKKETLALESKCLASRELEQAIVESMKKLKAKAADAKVTTRVQSAEEGEQETFELAKKLKALEAKVQRLPRDFLVESLADIKKLSEGMLGGDTVRVRLGGMDGMPGELTTDDEDFDEGKFQEAVDFLEKANGMGVELKQINLDGNDIVDAGAAALAPHLPTTLVTLDLSGHTFDDDD